MIDLASSRRGGVLVVLCLAPALTACGESGDEEASTAPAAVSDGGASKSEAEAADRVERSVDSDAGPAPEREPVKPPPSGDKSLHTFGDPAPDDTYRDIDRIVRAFYRATANNEPTAICGLLSNVVRGTFKQLAQRSPTAPDDTDCVDTLEAASRKLPPATARAYRQVHVIDARTNNDTGVAFFKIPGQPPSALPVRREDRQWRIATIGAIPLH